MVDLVFGLFSVAKRKSLFDDKPVEIQELTYIIKQDISTLNKQIAKLQEVSHSSWTCLSFFPLTSASLSKKSRSICIVTDQWSSQYNHYARVLSTNWQVYNSVLALGSEHFHRPFSVVSVGKSQASSKW